MTEPENQASVDLSAGVPLNQLPDGALLQGKLGEDDVLLVRRGEDIFAVGANCPHYGGPLAKGLVVGDQIRCPLHHACFSLRTGELLRMPALDSIPCWRVERRGDRVFVREKLPASTRAATDKTQHPRSIVIVGGGAAGLAAARVLHRQAHRPGIGLPGHPVGSRTAQSRAAQRQVLRLRAIAVGDGRRPRQTRHTGGY